MIGMNKDTVKTKEDEVVRETKMMIEKAIKYATKAHEGQKRKGGKDVPYITHPLAVAEILKSHGATAETIIAGILHDVVEDTPITLSDLAKEFGKGVATLVDYVSEVKTDDDEKKRPWKIRKKEYITRLESGPYEAVLVASADKLHNLRDTLEDYTKHGDDIWSMFNSKKDSQFWYYNTMIDIFIERGVPKEITEELSSILTNIHYKFVL